MRTSISLSALVMALTVLAAAGCGMGASSTAAWREPRTTRVPYAHVLIVGVSPSSRVRHSFEQQLQELIAAGRTRASASVYVASEMNAGPLSRETVRAMVEKTGADAVLVTQLRHRTVSAAMSQEKAHVKLGRTVTVIEQPGVTEVYAANYSIEEEPTERIVKSAAVVDTSLYDVAEAGRLVYEIETDLNFEEVDGDEIPDVAGDLADSVAARLRGDGLIQ